MQELIGIYTDRGLTPALAAQVADQLTAHDALGTHARDELGIVEATRAHFKRPRRRPPRLLSGAGLPLVLAAFCPAGTLTVAVIGSSLVVLALLGGAAARLGGAPVLAGALRVTFWGAVAMGVTDLVGRVFGTIA